jgi:hypothetical protein
MIQRYDVFLMDCSLSSEGNMVLVEDVKPVLELLRSYMAEHERRNPDYSYNGPSVCNCPLCEMGKKALE